MLAVLFVDVQSRDGFGRFFHELDVIFLTAEVAFYGSHIFWKMFLDEKYKKA